MKDSTEMKEVRDRKSDAISNASYIMCTYMYKYSHQTLYKQCVMDNGTCVTESTSREVIYVSSGEAVCAETFSRSALAPFFQNRSYAVRGGNNGEW